MTPARCKSGFLDILESERIRLRGPRLHQSDSRDVPVVTGRKYRCDNSQLTRLLLSVNRK